MTFTIGCCLSSRGQQKWIGVWQTGTKKLVHSYATKLDGLDINKITTNSRNVNEAGLWLVCIVNSESQILRNDSIISRSDYEPEPYYVNGFYWDGVIGDKNSKYRELPDGHWFRYHTWSNPKKNYLEWDKTVINGLIEGIVNVYDSNRKIESVSEYKRGLRSGFSLFYSEGTVREISYYQNGTFLEDIILYENQQLMLLEHGTKKVC
jgi:antitoxin component YwqK of YwqJK toxin-antitoxin module